MSSKANGTISSRTTRLWNALKSVLRIRHQLKVRVLSFLLIEKGKLRDYAHTHSLSDQQQIFCSNSFLMHSSRNFFAEIPEKQYIFASPCILTLEHAHVVGPYSVPFIKNRLATEHLGGNKVTCLTLPVLSYIASRLKKTQQSYTKTFFINSPYCHNFYHWFFDCLIILKQYEEYLLTDPDCNLMINAWNPWQKRSLELLGYSEDQYSPWAYEHGKVEKLVVPEATHRQGGAVRTGDVLWLRDRILQNSCFLNENSSNKFSDRVFVSRRDVPHKIRLSNEAAVSQRLTGFGFTEYVLGDMPLDDQIALFSNAKFVVASHGAGLTNLMYMRGGQVIEIHSDSFKDCYFNISQQLGLDYFGIMAPKNYLGEFEVDETFVVAAVERALAIGSSSRRGAS